MFSKKYQEELFEKKYNSMKQMDRLEFRNMKLSQGNQLIVSSISIMTFGLLAIIAEFFAVAAATSLANLKDYSLDTHNALTYLSGMSFLSFLCILAAMVFTIIMIRAFTKSQIENEKFLEEHTK